MNQKQILIAVASKTGTARQCAALLADRLPNGWLEVCNLERKRPSPADYDLVVVFDSVRMGRLHKAARQYLYSNPMLLQAITAVYFGWYDIVLIQCNSICPNIQSNVFSFMRIVECFAKGTAIMKSKSSQKEILLYANQWFHADAAGCCTWRLSERRF